MKLFVSIVLIFGGILAGCSASSDTGTGVNAITPAQTYKVLGRDTSFVFLDVRTPAEYKSETGHLEGAILIPVDSMENHLGELAPYRSRTIVVYCRSGHRSARAEKILAQHGFSALSMLGGIIRWNNEKLPVVKEPQ